MANLRLLLWPECDRDCEYCCNKQYDLNALPVAPDFREYGEIILTGGEPLLYPHVLLDEIKRIKRRTMAFIYLYTACSTKQVSFLRVLREVHGITLTIHKQEDVDDFYRLQRVLDLHYPDIKHKSLRLNIRNGINMMGMVSHYWHVDFWEPQLVCPVPDNEVLMRLRP